jgi:hypothetical protein
VFQKINDEQQGELKLKYSLLSEYMNTVGNNLDELFEFDSDFMPYIDNPNSYWTGYYASYPALKREARKAETVLRAANFLYTLSPCTKLMQELERLREIVSDVTHHDGITGTSKKAVVNDYYIPRLQKATSAAQLEIAQAVKRLTGSSHDITFEPPSIKTDLSTTIVAFNGLSWDRDNVMILPIVSNGKKVCVLDTNGKSIPTQLIGDSIHNERLLFSANVPALGFSSFSLEHDCESGVATPSPVKMTDEFEVTTDVLTATFCKTGNSLLLCRVKNLKDNLDVNVGQQYYSYTPHEYGGQNSGAYIFRPQSDTAEPLPLDNVQTLYSKGPICKSVEQIINGYIKQVYTLCHGRDHIYTEIRIGGNDQPPKSEIVTRIGGTDIDNNRILYCDKNGIETRRMEYPQTGGVAGSFLPMTSSCYIRNVTNEKDTVQLSVLSLQATGASATKNGHMELMLYRRTPSDDGKGVDENLDDTRPYTMNIHIRLTKVKNLPYQPESVILSKEAKEFDYPIVVLVGETSDESTHTQLHTPSFVHDTLPDSVHIVSLDTTMDRSLSPTPYAERNSTSRTVLRLQHMGMGDDVRISLDKSLKRMNMVITEETNLSATKKIANNDFTELPLKKNQIRTFILKKAPEEIPSSPMPLFKQPSLVISQAFTICLVISVALVVALLIMINTYYWFSQRSSGTNHQL